MAPKKRRPDASEPSAPSQVVPTFFVLGALAVYFLLFYAAGLPSLSRGGPDLVSRAELLFVVLFRFDEVAASWFGAPGQWSLWDRVPVLAIAGAILGFALGLGWLLMALFRADRGLTRLERFVFSTAVGLNFVSTYVLLVGLAGLSDSRLVLAVPAVLTLAGVAWLGWRRKAGSHSKAHESLCQSQLPSPRLRGEGSGVRGSRRAERDDASPKHLRDAAWLPPSWLWLAAPFVLVIFLGGMLPPIEFDVREYHLEAPKEFFQQGYVGFLPHNVYGNMPMGTEMLSLLAMAIAGDWWLGALAGKTVIAAFAPLTALGLYGAGCRFFSRTAGVVAAVVYISIPWIAQVSSLGLVEGASACYLFLALYAVLLRRGQGIGDRGQGIGDRERTMIDDWSLSPVPCALSPIPCSLSPIPYPLSPIPYPLSPLLAGYLAGGAVSSKYPAVLFVLVPLAIWILLDPRGRQETGSPGAKAERVSRFRRLGGDAALTLAWKPLGVFLLAAALGCGLWFGKNWVLAGNPTYPLLYGVFGSQTKTWTPEKNRQWNEVHRPKDFSPRALAKDVARVGLRSEWLSPLVMPLAALAFLVRRKRRLAVGLLACFGWVIATWWLLTHRIDRFWLPALPLVALLAGAGACWSRDLIWRRVLIGLLVLGTVANFLVVTSVAGGYNRYFVSLARLRDDPDRVDPWHRYFNIHARGGRVLMVGDAEVFDLEVPVLYSTCFDDSAFERFVKGRTPEEIRAAMAREGISHVYVHWGEIHRYRSPGNYGFTDFVEPAVFDRLVRQRVLEPLPEIQGHPGRGYRVVLAMLAPAAQARSVWRVQ